jgi:hypothetical protein
VRDNEGHEVIAKGQTLSDEKILGMNWLVEGVQGKITPLTLLRVGFTGLAIRHPQA